MPESRTHPHIDMPSEGQLRSLIEDRDPVIQELYLAAHRLVVDAVPDVAYSVDCVDRAIGYGARQYGYDGWGMAAVSPYTKWVNLGFVRGATLADPDGLLEGTASATRHVKLCALEQLTEPGESIRQLLQAATGLYGQGR